MASEKEESLIKKRMGYKENLIKNLLRLTTDYLNNFEKLEYEECDEKVTYLLCEADYLDSIITKMENHSLAEKLDTIHNEKMITEIQGQIEEARGVIDQKEKEYKNVLKVKACKEEYENIAKEINTYPRVQRIEEKVWQLV